MTIVQGLRRAVGLGSKTAAVEDAAKEFIAARWEKVRSAYTIYHQSVWRSLLYYVGEMWIKWDTDRKIYTQDAPADKFVPQPRINRFAPAVDAVCANFAAVPEIEAVPADSMAHEDDLRRHGIAEVANDLLDWWMAEEGLRGDHLTSEGKVGSAALLFTLTGCFFTELRLERLERVAPAPTGTVEDAPETPATPAAAAGAGQGWRVRCEVAPPLCAFPRPGAVTMADSGWLLWARRRSLDEIERRWGYQAQPDEERASGASLGLQQALQFYYQGFGAVASDLRDSALVVELFAPPGTAPAKLGPGGCYAVYCNERVIHAEAWQWAEHPLTMAAYQPNPELFFPRAVGFDLADVQCELKDYESLVKLNTMVNAAAAWVADESTRVSEITGRADRVIWWRSLGPGSAPPHREPAQPLAPDVFAKIAVLKEELEGISGAVSVFRGEQPGSIKAASAIAQLRGQAEQMFSRPVINWNGVWRETARKAVRLMQRHMSLAQITSIVGRERATAVQDFVNADLDRVIEFVATQNGLPRTRDEKRQELMLMWDKGALDLTDANVREKVYELFGETGMMQSFNADASRARKENRDIRNGGKPNFLPQIEDLAVHYAIHAQAIKSLDFDTWAPEARQALIAHALQTKAAMEALAARHGPQPRPPAETINYKDVAASNPAAAAAMLRQANLPPGAPPQPELPQPAAPVGATAGA